MRAYRLRGVVLVIASLCATSVHAQTSISEAGVRVHGGLHFPSVASYNIGYRAGAAGFFTHFFCGKRYGYWLETGLQAGTFSIAGTPRIDFLLTQLDLGAYLKLRAHRSNRKKEWALLVGPKVAPLLVQASNTLDPDRRVGFVLALHTSVCYKAPMGKRSSLAIHPGLEWNSNLSPPLRPIDLTNLYVFLGASLMLWQGL